MIKRARKSLVGVEPPVLEADRDEFLEHLAGELEIDDSDLVGEMTRQPDIYYRVGRELVRLMLYQDVMARDLRTARTRVESGLRRVARERGEHWVLPEEELYMQIRSHADVERATQKHSEARRRVRAYRVLYWAFEQRADILLGLTQLRKS